MLLPHRFGVRHHPIKSEPLSGPSINPHPKLKSKDVSLLGSSEYVKTLLICMCLSIHTINKLKFHIVIVIKPLLRLFY